MDISQFYAREDEKPLDNLVEDGGFCKIFRTVACIGDSLSSGQFESCDEHGAKGYHNYYDYSWGQYMARQAGMKVYNFSKGGMTAQVYCESFAPMNGFWEEDKLCQAYIIALGFNDILGHNQEIGSVSDINLAARAKNKETFAGYYARIIQNLKTKQPKAKFFLMTMPKETNEEHNKLKEQHAKLLHDMADLFDNTYVLDFYQYAPVYDDEFKRRFYLGGHMNAAGYVLTAKMVMSYIDYIIRHNPEDFVQVPFIGKQYHNHNLKW